MRIKGFEPFSASDWPGRLAAVIFCGGCNLACGYCHNSRLIRDAAPWLDEDEVFAELERRRFMLDGVVVSGGESTLQPDLAEKIARLKEMGYLVKLDTNGLRPEVLKPLLESGSVDFVALDFKTPLDDAWLAKICGARPGSAERIRESYRLVAESGAEREWRTTCAPGVTGEALLRMADELKEIAGPEAPWFWQQYRVPEQGADPALEPALDHGRVSVLRERAVPRPALRGWDVDSGR